MKLTWKSASANLLLLAMIGCNGGDEPSDAPKMTPATPPPTKTEKAPADSKTEPKKGDDGPKLDAPKADNSKSEGGATTLTAKQLAAIKQLPEAEQAVALKQVVCPVNGGPLGAMGKPYKVTFEGRSFYLCCDGCEDEVKADPKSIIAKLDKK